MNEHVNLAVQLLPLYTGERTYAVIDAAIEEIKKSRLQYVVTPFETVIEGPYTEVMALVDRIQSAAFTAGADEFLLNMKLQRRKNRDVRIQEKTGKYLTNE